jgi:hypothetical protein
MQHTVATITESQVLSNVMLATGATDQMVNFQPAATIGLRPPAHRTAAVLFNPRQQFLLLSLIHTVAPSHA